MCRKRAASLRGGTQVQCQEMAIGLQFWIENRGAWDLNFAV